MDLTSSAPTTARTERAAGGSSATLPELLVARAKADPQRLVFQAKRRGQWRAIRLAEYTTAVRELAAGLRALGLASGQTVGLLGRNRFEWLIADGGIQAAGGVSLALHPNLPPADLAALARQTDCRVWWLEDAEQLARLRAAGDALPAPQQIIVLDQRDVPPDLSLPISEHVEVGARGRASGEAEPEPGPMADVPACWLVSPGTSGAPRLVSVSHGQLLAQASAWREALAPRSGWRLLTILPLALPVERAVMQGAALLAGAVVCFPESAETVPQELRVVRPQVVTGSPQTWARQRASLLAQIDAAPRLKRWLARRTLAGRLPLGRLLLRGLGLDRTRVALVHGASLPPDLRAFCARLGLALRESYGLTESAGLGSIDGQATPGLEWRLDESGQILLRGPLVAGALDANGWLATGDQGQRAADGSLRVLGRRGELFPGPDGQLVAPAPIADRLRASPYVQDVLVGPGPDGDAAALVSLNEAAIGRLAQTRRLSLEPGVDLAQQPGVRELLRGEVRRLGVAVARIAVLPQPLRGDDVLTPTGLVRRAVVWERYQGWLHDQAVKI